VRRRVHADRYTAAAAKREDVLNAPAVHLETALLALRLGYSPLPPREDGTKAPLADIQGPNGQTWLPYQTTPATEAHVRKWYSNGRTGNGLATGFNNLEAFEFEQRDTHDDFLDAAGGAGLTDLVNRIRTGYEEFTPGGGVHWLYRCIERRGNEKLAERPDPADPTNRDKRKCLIETRGQGGFIIIAPSNGKVHRSGGAYRLVCGGLERVVEISPEERDELWALARSFDEMPKEAAPDPDEPFVSTVKLTGSAYPKQGVRPGDDFAERTTWEAILEPAGWVKAFTRGETVCWRRPGKDRGVSATTGHCKGLKVFTTSTSFKAEGTYTKLGAHAALNHGGDFKAAIKALAEKGFGTWIGDDGREHQNPVPKEWFERKKKASQSGGQGIAPQPETEVDWEAMSDEDMGILSGEKIDPKPVEWAWPDRIAKKKMNIIAGEGKKGKTQLVLAAAAITTVGGELPDGSGRVEKGTVIILSAEDDPEDTLAPRLLALGADMTKIKIIKTEFIIRRKGREPEINPIDFQRLSYWRALFKRFPDLQLFIADPVPSFLGRGVNDHKNAEIRSILTPFLDVIREFNVAMIAVTHLAKAVDPKRPASHRIIGSIAYANLARSIHFVAKDPDSPARRLFMMAENTSAASDIPAVAFVLEPREVVNRGGEVFEIWVPRFETDTVDVDVNEVVNSDVKKPGRPLAQKSVVLAKWVLSYLRNVGSPVRLGEVYNAAGDAGFIGEYGPQKDGKIRWSAGYQLTRAIARVQHLEGDDAGWLVDEFDVEGRKHMRLIAKPQNHPERAPESVAF
jgi:hypothetical protein